MTDVAPATQQPLRAPAVSRRRIVANFLTIAGTNILGLIVTILISVYVRRAMGPAAVGQISWAMAAVAYLTVLVSPGLAIVGQRELSNAPQRSQGLVALILTLQTLLALPGLCPGPGHRGARAARAHHEHAACHTGCDAFLHRLEHDLGPAGA